MDSNHQSCFTNISKQHRHMHCVLKMGQDLLTLLDHFFIVIFIEGSCFQIFQSATQLVDPCVSLILLTSRNHFVKVLQPTFHTLIKKKLNINLFPTLIINTTIIIICNNHGVQMQRLNTIQLESFKLDGVFAFYLINIFITTL